MAGEAGWFSHERQINLAATSQPAAAVAAGTRARPLTLPPDPQGQRLHRAAVADCAGVARGRLSRAARDRRAVSHFESEPGRGAGAHAGTRLGRAAAPATR